MRRGGADRCRRPTGLNLTMAMRCAACGNRAPDAPGPAQLPDPDGIRDDWREHWDREESTPRYTYSPSTTCNGCWGWLVDTDTNAMVWQGAVPFGMFRAPVCADAYRPERQVWAVSQGALYPGLQLALEVK